MLIVSTNKSCNVLKLLKGICLLTDFLTEYLSGNRIWLRCSANLSTTQLIFSQIQRLRTSKTAFATYICKNLKLAMKNQYCKVGATTPIADGRHAIHLLEYQYQNFMEKASQINDAKLVEFFELKAQKIKKILENLA